MEFLKVIYSNSVSKSINLIYLLSTISPPSAEILDNNTLFVAWAEKTYNENPLAFRLDLLQKSAFLLEGADHLSERLSEQVSLV